MASPLTGRCMVWGGFAAVLILLPFFFGSELALSLASRMCIAIIFALSYNMLLGHGGMLSFGHAVYAGLGSYFTIHALNAWGAHMPVSLLPLVGGLAGVLFGVLFGYVSTKRSGTPFAMISLGIGELVAAGALMIPAFFGGEAGVSGNRVTGEGWFGINFGPQNQVYYLIAAWTFVSVLAMFAITRTPLGRMANAVRENPERVQFIGYNTHLVRFYTLVLASFFAGISGGLAAINFEIVTAETVGAHASGIVLLMTFIGGIGQFFGPVIGAVVVTLLQSVLSSVTPAWQFYFGILFLGMVMFAPGGISSLLVLHGPLWNAKRLFKLLAPSYLFAAMAGVVLLLGMIGMVEISYHLSEAAAAPTMSIFSLSFNPHGWAPWAVALALVAAGIWLLRIAFEKVSQAWSVVSAELLAMRVGRSVNAATSDVPLGGAEKARP